MDEDEEKPFSADRAKTGRSGCKRCKGKIESGSLRVARLQSNPFGGEGSKMKAWHHVACLFEALTKARASTRSLESPEDDIEGWEALSPEDQAEIERHLEELRETRQDKTKKTAKPNPPKKTPAPSKPTPQSPKKTQSPKKAPPPPQPALSGQVSEASQASTSSQASSTGHHETCHKDESFRQFRSICATLADTPAYLEKSALVREFLAKGSAGDGFHGDTLLWMRMLLPMAKKRVYNLQSKQIVKLFSRILGAELEDMLEDLEQGDVAATVKVFFEQSTTCQPHKRSTLSMKQVDDFLEKLATVRTEEEQTNHFQNITKRCTGNDLQMIIRLIKHDLRINAGPKHILDALHADAYEAFQNSRDLDSVVSRVLKRDEQGGELQIGIALMTPVLPMLAEVCKSVTQAMDRCPHGMYSEVKYDGERVQVHKRGSEFKFFSRSLKPVAPHKVAHLSQYIPQAFPHGRDLILDSEVLLMDTSTGKPLPFGTLGVHKKAEFKNASVCLFVFDCLYFNGEVLLNKSVEARRRILKENMTEVPCHVVFSEVEEIREQRKLEKMIARVLSEGLEGLVLKDLKSTYEPGKRHWLKVKKDYLAGGKMADTADLVPLGAWFGTGSKGGIMSIFLMCCYDPIRQRWLSVTKVHGGFDDKELEALQTKLQMTKISKDPERVPRWLKLNRAHTPDFIAKDPTEMPVWEITGAEFTENDVHTAGISVRFPRVTRQRDDKTYKESTNLAELRTLYENSRHGTDVASLFGSSPPPASHEDKHDKPCKTDKTDKKKTSSESPKKSPEKGQAQLDSFFQKTKKKAAEEEGAGPSKYPQKRPAPSTSTLDSPPKKKATPESPKKRPAEPSTSAAASMQKTNGVFKPPVKKPLPNIFQGVKMVLPNWASSRIEELRRRFIAYGGEMLTIKNSSQATHQLYDEQHPPPRGRDPRAVRPTWLWDSFRTLQLQPALRYAPS